MNGKLKKAIKVGLTVIQHPIITFELCRSGCNDFVLRGKGTVNNCKHLHIGKNTEIGSDFRFLLIEKYHRGGTILPRL